MYAQIEWQFKKFIGSLEIPSYNNLQNYNFHDTLNALVNKLFERHH